MDRTRRTVFSWDTPSRALDGRFTARTRGLLARRFVLLGPGNGHEEEEEFGRLDLRGPSRAELRLWGDAATIETSSKCRYRMLVREADREEVLAAVPQRPPVGGLAVRCGGRLYGVRVDLLRNRAVALDEGREAARLSGGALFGRGYRAVFDADDGCALPLAVFLLWFVATNRRRAYRRGSTLPPGGAM